MTANSVQGENTQPPPSSRSEKIEVIKIQTINTSQMTNSEETRLSPKMLMIGQLKKRAPRTNKNIQTSLLMGSLLSISFPALPPESRNRHSRHGPTRGIVVSGYLNTIYGQIPYEKTGGHGGFRALISICSTRAAVFLTQPDRSCCQFPEHGLFPVIFSLPSRSFRSPLLS